MSHEFLTPDDLQWSADDDRSNELFATRRVLLRPLAWEHVPIEERTFLRAELVRRRKAIRSFLKANAPSNYEIHCEFSEQSFGARATKAVGGPECIFFGAYTPLVLVNFFRLVLSGARFAVSDPGAMHEVAFNEGRLLKVPLPPAFPQLDQVLTECVMNWIMYHELCHIWHGHLDFDEKFSSSRAGTSLIDRQTLEWDADNFATEVMLRSIIHTGPVAELESWRDRLFQHFRLDGLVRARPAAFQLRSAVALFSAMFAVSAYMKLDEAPWDAAEATQKTHPPHELRRDLATWFFPAIGKHNGLNELDCFDLASAAKITADDVIERALRRKWPKTLDPAELLAAFDEEKGRIARYANQLRANWAVLQPILSQFERAPERARMPGPDGRPQKPLASAQPGA